MLKFLRFTGVTILLTAFCSTVNIAQEKQDDEQIRIGTNLVSVNVSVTDTKGRYVAGLQRRQFEIYDNGIKQQIGHFSTEAAPVTFGIVYDMHPTTSERTETVLSALRQFTKSLGATDDFFIVVFNERGSLALDFIPTAEQVATHIPMGLTKETNSLYDAIYLAAEKIRVRKNPKRALIVISDGVDHNSRHNFQELRCRLRGFDVQVYAIEINDLMPNNWVYSDLMLGRKPRTLSQDVVSGLERAALEEIANSSGGTSYSSEVKSKLELYGICTQIASEMRQQYTISFYPKDSTTKGKWHKLKVRMTPIDGTTGAYHLSYREGYQLQ